MKGDFWRDGSMSKLLRCDRCGKTYDEKQGKIIMYFRNKFWTPEKDKDKFDICKECTDSLNKWFDEMEAKE